MSATRHLRTVYDLRPQIDDSPSRQRSKFPEISEAEFWELYEVAKPYSMLSVTGFYSLYQGVRYVVANDIPGDFVECGALFGGACIFVALLRERLGARARTLHVFDTFSGFPKGSEDTRRGEPSRGPSYESFFGAVIENFERTCGRGGVEFYVGEVERTLPRFPPPPISLLRLDTDFYASTKVELEILYPALSPGGVLIIDDYGYYDGARRATDEYLASCQRTPLLNRIDPGIWAGIKPQG